jgi:hypothetical protein
VNRRSFLFGLAGLSATPQIAPPGFRLTDVTAQAGLKFQHNSGAYGGKLLPETLGSGCAFLDYDGDGWLDILLINGMDWPGHKRQRSTMRLYRNNRNGTFTDVTRAAGLEVEMYGMGVAVADYDNDGFPDIFVTCVGQNRLFKNNGKGAFIDVTQKSGLGGREAFSTSALWFDYDRDGLLDLFVCNYVKWSAEHDVFCSVDGKQKSYCTPEAYRGETCWLFRNRGNGTFEDVTATSGIFDSSSKSLGVALLDYDQDGWPDLIVADDTQPNKLYRNMRNGTFSEVAVQAGLAFSTEGKARAGMGIDAADLDNSGRPSVLVTNFDNEMIGLYTPIRKGIYEDVAIQAGVGVPSRNTLGFGCSFVDADLDGFLDLVIANGHIDETVRNIRGTIGYAQAPRRRSPRRFRIQPAQSRARPCLRRLRSRWRLRHSDVHKQWAGVSLSQRSARGKSQHPLSPHRHEIQPRCDRSAGAHFPRRLEPVSHSEERFELFVAIGVVCHVRCRTPRSNRSCRDSLAERQR